MNQSSSFSLNGTDYAKLFRNLLVVMAGAGLTFLTDMLPSIDFGQWTPAVTALFAILVDIARRFLYGSPNSEVV